MKGCFGRQYPRGLSRSISGDSDPGQALEVQVTGQQVGIVGLCGCIDDGIGGGQLGPDAEFRHRERGGRIEISDRARGKAITWSALSSPASRVSHLASSSWTMVGTSHSLDSGNSAVRAKPTGEPISHSIQAEVSTSRIRFGRSDRDDPRGSRRVPGRRDLRAGVRGPGNALALGDKGEHLARTPLPHGPHRFRDRDLKL
jgi:hypothetical protein